MKIRHGFVSNSSSTSFSIYGASLEKNEDDKLGWEDVRNLGLEIFYGEDGDPYIGRSWNTIKDNETGLQFKESTRKNIADLIKQQESKINCSNIEVSYYNG